jgi:hypothetical protein
MLKLATVAALSLLLSSAPGQAYVIHCDKASIAKLEAVISGTPSLSDEKKGEAMKALQNARQLLAANRNCDRPLTEVMKGLNSAPGDQGVAPN